MKKKRIIGVAVATVLLLLTAVYLWAPGSAPRGQEPVVTLSEGNLGEFEKEFDAETDVPEYWALVVGLSFAIYPWGLVLLLSPS
jgi:hypothetical protein